MKILNILALSTVTLLTAQAQEPVPYLVWGAGGYANALSRLEAKGDAADQREAIAELKWLQANEAHINKLLTFVNGWWQYRLQNPEQK